MISENELQGNSAASTSVSLSPHSFESRSVVVVENIEVAEINEIDCERGVAAALRYCKTTVLVPYLRFLSIIGLRPLLINAAGHWPKVTSIVNYIYLALVLNILILGYVLQYLACFRRDRGPSVKIVINESSDDIGEQCPGNFFFNFIIPNLLHLGTYIYALQLFRLRADEHLQNLMERVFVISYTTNEGTARLRQLVRSLWLLIGMAGLWLLAVSITSGFILVHNPPTFQKLVEHSASRIEIMMCSFLFVGTLAQDIFQATLFSGYCLQAQLLAALATSLHQRLLQHTLTPLDWMREMREFGQLLHHLNQELAPAVCVLGLVCSSWALSAAAWLLGWTKSIQPAPMPGLSVLPVIFWTLLIIIPFIQAARLSSHCQRLQRVGHEVRARPFVYQDTPAEELDSLLLFSSSLRLKARLCGTPISGQGLWILLVIVAIVALTLGQIQRLPLPWPELSK